MKCLQGTENLILPPSEKKLNKNKNAYAQIHVRGHEVLVSGGGVRHEYAHAVGLKVVEGRATCLVQRACQLANVHLQLGEGLLTLARHPHLEALELKLGKIKYNTIGKFVLGLI